jgi:UDP-glucose 4-epimerase
LKSPARPYGKAGECCVFRTASQYKPNEELRLTSLIGKNVLVTGGGGFIGSHIVDLLIHEACRSIVVVDNFIRGNPANLASALAHPNVSLVRGDIRDRILMRDLLRTTDIVFHQAALRITQCVVEPRAAIEGMIDATFDLAEACSNYSVEKVIFASSASIYGMAEEFPTSERQHSYANDTLYGVAKLFGEGVLRALAIPHVALRYFNVYGPRMDVHGRYTEVLVRWIERIELGLPPIIFGEGTETMDFIDVRDVARANLLATKCDATGEAFNIGTGTETSLLQLASELASIMGRPHLSPLFEPRRAVNSVDRRLADTTKARKILEFSARIPLRSGLANLVAWWHTQRQIVPERGTVP